LKNYTVFKKIPTLFGYFDFYFYAGGNRATGPAPSVVSGFESIFGYNRGDLDYKLLHMLNYGSIIGDSTPLVGGTANRWWNMQSPLDAAGNNLYSQRFSFNLSVNLLPLASYQKIYQDFYRWSQWESADPTSYNFDWYAGSGSVFGSGLGSTIPSSNAIGNVIICFPFVIVIGIRIYLWECFQILSLVM
jgi:hypothetical protein